MASRDEVRVRLQNLGHRALLGVERVAAVVLPTPEVMHKRVLDALRSVASGDLSLATLTPTTGTREGEALAQIVQRMRALVSLGRELLKRESAAVTAVAEASARVGDLAMRQRVGFERVGEQVSSAAARLRELGALAAEVRESSDRAALLALNAGIEGMRVGGETARALASLGEEIRRLGQRASETAGALAAGLKDVERELTEAGGQLDEAGTRGRALEEAATRAAAEAEAARRAEHELSLALGNYRVLDDETEVLVASLAAAADKLTRDVRDARERLRDADPGTREVIEGALAGLTRAVREKT